MNTATTIYPVHLRDAGRLLWTTHIALRGCTVESAAELAQLEDADAPDA